MIHIVFQTADVTLLEQAMELDSSLKGPTFEIKDEWGVGPLAALETEEGWQARLEWWKMIFQDSPHDGSVVGSFDDRRTVDSIKNHLTENEKEEAWIWMGQNQHDVTGYYWLMPQLKEFQGRVMVLYLNNLPFINEKGSIFYPNHISEVLPKEAVKAKRLARPITLSEFEVDPDEWARLAEDNDLVRILEGGKKIVGKEVDFYDIELVRNLTSEWQKAWRLLSNTQNRMKIKTGDTFLMWRIRELVHSQKVDANGDPAKWKELELKLREFKQMQLSDQF